MTRYIDSLPTPEKTRHVKLIVLSFSRSATLGVYNACNILGYRSYHTLEAFKNGVHDMKILNEALESGLYEDRGKPFSRNEFDKWFADYDVITEMPCYMAPQFVAAYPNAQYLLVERNPDNLVQSWKATIFMFADALDVLPMSLLKHFDPMLSQIDRFCKVILPAVTYGKGTGQDSAPGLRRYYVDYLEKVKKLVPAEKLHIVQLEDGLGWEQLCPLLKEENPNVPWPIKHSSAEFKKVMGAPLTPGAQRAMLRVLVSASLILGASAWWIFGLYPTHECALDSAAGGTVVNEFTSLPRTDDSCSFENWE